MSSALRINYQVAVVVFILLFLSSLLAANALCQDYQENKATLQHVDELLTQGENQQAWKLLREGPEVGPDSADRLWRKARTQYEMGRLANQNIPEFFKKSEEYARAAIAANPDSSDSYKWLAIALGAQAKYSDTKEQIAQSREIKESIEKAIALNPDDDIAYLVLSRWHYKVSALGVVARTFARIIYGGVPKASLAEAEELLLKAIALHDRISHRYNLAKVYARMKRNDDEIIQLQKALLLPVTFPEEAEEQEKSRKKLKRLP